MHAEQYAATPNVVVIARGWGGTRAIVPSRALRGFHVAIDEGGAHRGLPHPMLGAYLADCRLLPAAFGHDCAHGPPPHTIKIVIPRRGNTAELYTELWEHGRRLVHGYRRRSRQSSKRSPAAMNPKIAAVNTSPPKNTHSGHAQPTQT